MKLERLSLAFLSVLFGMKTALILWQVERPDVGEWIWLAAVFVTIVILTFHSPARTEAEPHE